MYFYRSALSILVFAFIAMLLPLSIDFYLLAFFEGTLEGWPAKILQGYEPWLVLNRSLVLLLYYLILLVAMRLPSYQGPARPSASLPAFVQGAGLLLFGSAAAGFVLFERLPLTVLPFYPGFFAATVISMPFVSFLFFVRPKKFHSFIRRKRAGGSDVIHIQLEKQGWVNVKEPFAHTLILAGSGAGKTLSLVRPFLRQFIDKGFCGILYDFKNPDLTDELNTILVSNEHRTSLPFYIINFRDVRKSHRFNILCPELIRNANYAEEYALSIMSNLDKSILRDPGNFFSRSSINYLTAIIWFLKKKHPACCTLPHAINIALYADFAHVLSMLQCDPVAADKVSAVVTSFEQKAERQLAGQLSSVQNLLSTINTPEVAWILSGNDFVPDINSPDDPKIVAVGNDPGMSKSLASVISCIFTVVLKNMNQEGKNKSFVLLDEAPTIYVPDLENIAALSRSNKMALVYIAQDLSMMTDMYGKDKSETIIANLSNRFFGRVNLPATARMVAEIVGREEREVVSLSEGLSDSGRGQNSSRNYSKHVQEKQIFRPEDLGRLKRGEFTGTTTDAGQPYFYGRFKRLRYRSFYKVGPFTHFEDQEREAPTEDIAVFPEDHLKKIKLEAEAIIKCYPNVFDGRRGGGGGGSIDCLKGRR